MAGAATFFRRHGLELAVVVAFSTFCFALWPPRDLSAPRLQELIIIAAAIALLAAVGYPYLASRFSAPRYWVPSLVACGVSVIALIVTLGTYQGLRTKYSVDVDGMNVVVGTDRDLTPEGQLSPDRADRGVLVRRTAGKPQDVWNATALQAYAGRMRRYFFASEVLAAIACVAFLCAWRAGRSRRVASTVAVGSAPAATAPAADASRRFLVALSFPGEVRDRVEPIAEELASVLGRERVFYDRWYGAELARPDMDLHLQGIYKSQSELLVVVLCADYERKEWCGLEWRVVRDLIKQKAASRIMFVRLDDTPIEGLLSIDGYLDIAGMTDDAVAAAILTRARSGT